MWELTSLWIANVAVWAAERVAVRWSKAASFEFDLSISNKILARNANFQPSHISATFCHIFLPDILSDRSMWALFANSCSNERNAKNLNPRSGMFGGILFDFRVFAFHHVEYRSWIMYRYVRFATSNLYPAIPYANPCLEKITKTS